MCYITLWWNSRKFKQGADVKKKNKKTTKVEKKLSRHNMIRCCRKRSTGSTERATLKSARRATTLIEQSCSVSTWIFLPPVLCKFRSSCKDFHSTRQFYADTGPRDILACTCNGTAGPEAPRKILRFRMARCNTGRTWPRLRLAAAWLRGRKVYD